jgi:hypothetical protein
MSAAATVAPLLSALFAAQVSRIGTEGSSAPGPGDGFRAFVEPAMRFTL